MKLVAFLLELPLLLLHESNLLLNSLDDLGAVKARLGASQPDNYKSTGATLTTESAPKNKVRGATLTTESAPKNKVRDATLSVE